MFDRWKQIGRCRGDCLRIVKRLLYLVSASRKQQSSIIGQRLFRAFESQSCCVRGERGKGSDFPPTSTPFGLRYLCLTYRRHSDKYIAVTACEIFASDSFRQRIDIALLKRNFLHEQGVVNYAAYLGRIRLYK